MSHRGWVSLCLLFALLLGVAAATAPGPAEYELCAIGSYAPPTSTAVLMRSLEEAVEKCTKTLVIGNARSGPVTIRRPGTQVVGLIVKISTPADPNNKVLPVLTVTIPTAAALPEANYTDLHRYDTGILIKADGVSIQGFTINLVLTNGTVSGWPWFGILGLGVNNTVLSSLDVTARAAHSPQQLGACRAGLLGAIVAFAPSAAVDVVPAFATVLLDTPPTAANLTAIETSPGSGSGNTIRGVSIVAELAPADTMCLWTTELTADRGLGFVASLRLIAEVGATISNLAVHVQWSGNDFTAALEAAYALSVVLSTPRRANVEVVKINGASLVLTTPSLDNRIGDVFVESSRATIGCILLIPTPWFVFPTNESDVERILITASRGDHFTNVRVYMAPALLHVVVNPNNAAVRVMSPVLCGVFRLANLEVPGPVWTPVVIGRLPRNLFFDGFTAVDDVTMAPFTVNDSVDIQSSAVASFPQWPPLVLFTPLVLLPSEAPVLPEGLLCVPYRDYINPVPVTQSPATAGPQGNADPSPSGAAAFVESWQGKVVAAAVFACLIAVAAWGTFAAVRSSRARDVAREAALRQRLEECLIVDGGVTATVSAPAPRTAKEADMRLNTTSNVGALPVARVSTPTASHLASARCALTPSPGPPQQTQQRRSSRGSVPTRAQATGPAHAGPSLDKVRRQPHHDHHDQRPLPKSQGSASASGPSTEQQRLLSADQQQAALNSREESILGTRSHPPLDDPPPPSLPPQDVAPPVTPSDAAPRPHQGSGSAVGLSAHDVEAPQPTAVSPAVPAPVVESDDATSYATLDSADFESRSDSE